MPSIADATIDLHANISRLRSDLARGQAEVRKFQTGVQRSFSTLRNFAAGFAGAFSVGVFVQFARQSVKMVADLADLSDQLRIGVEEIQALNIAAREAGAGAEEMQAGVLRLNEAIGEATGGNREMQKSFVDLGVAFEDVNGKSRSTEDVLADLAKAYAEAGDKTKFTSDLTNVMGRNAGRLAPVIAQLAVGWDKFTDSQRDAGIASEQTARDLDALAEEAERFKNQLLVWGAQAVHGWQLLLGIGLSEQGQLGVQIAEAEANVSRLQALLSGGMSPTGPLGMPEPMSAEFRTEQLQELTTATGHLLSLHEKLNALNRPSTGAAGAADPAVDPAETKAKAIKEETSALDQLMESMQEELALAHQTADGRERLTAQYKANAAAQEDYDKLLRESPLLTGEELAALDEKIERLQFVEEMMRRQAAREKEIKEEAEDAAEAQKESMRALTDEFESLAAGITNAALGFQEWGDFGKQAIESIFNLLFSELQKLETFGGEGGGLFGGGGGFDLGSIFGSIFSLFGSAAGGGTAAPVFGGLYAEGGSGVVDRPTMFIAGESGRERFNFTPMTGANDDGGATYIINIAGDADEAKIERVLRRHVPGIVRASEGSVMRRAGRSVGGANAWTRS